MKNGLLLDTHALIWFMRNDALSKPAVAAVRRAALQSELAISVVTAWEIGLLEVGRPNRPGIDFHSDAEAWFENALAITHASLVDLTPEIAIKASRLPEPFHRDPADRFLVATARVLELTLLTRDRDILRYAKAGHVKAIAC